ncbi:Fur-regulated basic protein FbpA [Neobacillus sp. Marseille-QA0830]
MKNLLRTVVKQRRQFLMEQLVQSGVYKKNNKHLYEWTLSELEDEYAYIYANHLQQRVEEQSDPILETN